VGWQEVVDVVLPTKGVGENVVCLPLAFDQAATEMAIATGLLKNLLPLGGSQRPTGHLVATSELLTATIFSQRFKACDELVGRLERVRGTHGTVPRNPLRS
jgi:hypothetical protein